MLANVLQVLPRGSVIVGHLRHRRMEGNARAAGPCAATVEHSCVRELGSVLASADFCVFASHKHTNLHLLTDQRIILCYIPQTVTPS